MKCYTFGIKTILVFLFKITSLGICPHQIYVENYNIPGHFPGGKYNMMLLLHKEEIQFSKESQ